MMATRDEIHRRVRHLRRLLRSSGDGPVVHLIPKPPDDLEVRRALEARRTLALLGWCGACGAGTELGDELDPAAVATVDHADGCPASDASLRSMVRSGRCCG